MEAKQNLYKKPSIQYMRDVRELFVLALIRVCIPFCKVKFSERFKNQYIYKLKILPDIQSVLTVILDLTKYQSAIQSDGSNKIPNHWKNNNNNNNNNKCIFW